MMTMMGGAATTTTIETRFATDAPPDPAPARCAGVDLFFDACTTFKELCRIGQSQSRLLTRNVVDLFAFIFSVLPAPAPLFPV